MTTHAFRTSGEAYAACQCDEAIKQGDLLVIASEGVVGIADTWPVAVTVTRGELHAPADGYTLAQCMTGRFAKVEQTIARAKAIAEQHRWPVRD